MYRLFSIHRPHRAGLAARSWIIATAVIASAIGFAIVKLSGPSPEHLLAQGVVAFSEKKFDRALEAAHAAVATRPELIEAHRLGAEAAAALNQFDDCVQSLRQIVERGNPAQTAEAAWKAADILLMKLQRPSDAEPLFKIAVSGDPPSAGARREYASLLGMCGRTSEANDLRIACLKAGDIHDVDLLLLGLGDTASENIEILHAVAKATPDDPLVKLGLARAAFQGHDLAQSENLLRDVLRDRADLTDAHALQGLVLVAANKRAAWPTWQNQLPPTADESAAVWFARGEMAEQLGQTPAACRCFWEAVRRDAAHQRAHYRLGQLLAGVDRADAAKDFAQRGADLQQLVLAVKAYSLDYNLSAAGRIVPLCLSCGLQWEAQGWAALARSKNIKIVAATPDVSSSRVAKDYDLAQRWKLDDLPLPVWRNASQPQPSISEAIASGGEQAIHFEDQAAQAGLNFRFVSGDDPEKPGMRTFEFTGGGVGVIDYDMDGWPDLYLTQGGEWPLDARDRVPLDRLFRNDGQGHFGDVTAGAVLVEDRYSQGLTVGDINQDGFPDLYIANLGLDRVFLNQGDGTFEDITESVGLRDDDWSTSCVLADFNGDALPDCFVVNYLQGPDLATKVCKNGDGRIRACTPHEFAAAPDRLLLNTGDGRFTDITQAADIKDANGKGLGVVALDADGSGRLSIFVANDTTGNSLWTPEPASADGTPKFVDRALLAGVALDRDGRSQACMGVGADDVDGDGLIDLFVTNYYDESNTFFHQMTAGLFEDATLDTRLREPSLKQLGFGTQFLDADRDGWLDLIVLNGHVDDERYRGVPYQMRPQCFRNLEAGRFVEVPQDKCGDWFTKPTLGRSLARVDWNRDGRDDFVATHRDELVGLLTNQTQPKGYGISLRLIGTRSNRDAIGAKIQVQTGSRTLTRQLVAGDGYQASNDRRILMSVGPQEIIQTLTITWPSGESQEFHDIPSNREYTFVEGVLPCVDREYPPASAP